jgi:uncharacterized membrane protein (DUF4010 family)
LSRRAQVAANTVVVSTAIIMIASTVAFVRVGAEVVLVAPDFALQVLPQLGVVAGVMAVTSVVAYAMAHGHQDDLPPVKDPANLRAALAFGALYAVVLFGVAAAQTHFGDAGVFVIAGLSGLTDVDGITLSTAELMKEGRLGVDTGWRMMLLAALSNVAFKGVMVGVLGPRRLLLRVGLMYLVALGSGGLVLWLWPHVG